MSSLVRLLQLASPALPIGGYSYSTGLEAAIEAGEVDDPDSAFDWIDDNLSLVVGRFDAPLLVAAVRACADANWRQLRELNRLALAARETAELRLESEQMGFSLMHWVAQVPAGDRGAADPASAGEAGEAGSAGAPLAELAAGPVAATIAWAAAAWRLQLSPLEAVTGHLWSFVENQVMVLIKTIPLGQIQAQRVLHRLGPRVEAVARCALALSPQHWSSAAPGLAIASMRHETQYSRLFRS